MVLLNIFWMSGGGVSLIPIWYMGFFGCFIVYSCGYGFLRSSASSWNIPSIVNP